MDAFRSTLEEVTQADAIIHVLDASDPQAEIQRDVVDLLLNELGAGGKPRLTVLNKVDLLGPFERSGLHGLTGKEEPQMVSARTGEGLPDLITAIARLAAEQFIPVDLVLPYDKTGWISRIEQQGKIESIEYTEAGIQVKARVRPALFHPLQREINKR